MRPQEKSRNADEGGAKKSKTQPPWVIDRLQFKSDTVGYIDRRRTHLYVYSLASKTQRQVTSGDFDDAQPAWSPDGKSLAFASNRAKPDPDRTYNSDIWSGGRRQYRPGRPPRASHQFSWAEGSSLLVARWKVDYLLELRWT